MCDDKLSMHTHDCKPPANKLASRLWLNVIHKAPLYVSTKQAVSMRRQPRSPKKQLRRWEGAGLGPEPYSDGAFPWQWAAPRLNSPPLFMLFGGEAGFPPRDRWPFSHKVLCLDLACSGARQQSSDDTAFGKQLPDAEVVATGSTENWLTHRASNQMTREAAQLQLNLPRRGEAKQGTPEIMTGLRNQRSGLAWRYMTQLNLDSTQSNLELLLTSDQMPPTESIHPEKRKHQFCF